MTDPYLDPAPGTVAAEPLPTVEVVPPAQPISGGDLMRPDVTKVQIIALVGSVLSTLTAFGVDITPEQREALLDLIGQLAVVAVLADAALRIGRNLSDRNSIK